MGRARNAVILDKVDLVVIATFAEGVWIYLFFTLKEDIKQQIKQKFNVEERSFLGTNYLRYYSEDQPFEVNPTIQGLFAAGGVEVVEL